MKDNFTLFMLWDLLNNIIAGREGAAKEGALNLAKVIEFEEEPFPTQQEACQMILDYVSLKIIVPGVGQTTETKSVKEQADALVAQLLPTKE